MMEGTSIKENGKGSRSSSRRCRGVWTNEMHLRFLNTIEASFVQAMFEKVNYNSNNNNCDLRLDRHIPDSYESTQDLPVAKLRRPRTSSTSPGVEEQSVRASKKNKGQVSNDQVVPEVEIRRDNENDKDGESVDGST